jgi:hypothetical protein
MKTLGDWRRNAVASAQIVAMLAGLLALLAAPMPANAGPKEPSITPAQCYQLEVEDAEALAAKNYTRAVSLDRQIGYYGCPPDPSIVVCKSGIANIQNFLQTSPATDPAFAKINQALPVYFDGAPISTATLTQDIGVVAASLQSASAPAPTLRQQFEYMSAQVMRTIYYVDSQGTVGCPYPWTNGRSLYAWMTSLLGGIDLRDDSMYSDCCESIGGKFVIAIIEPAASQYPTTYNTWGGIAERIALYIHEARHAPGNVTPSTGQPAYLHTTCCPEQQAGQAASCDQSYNAGATQTPYATQYWLFIAWLNGTVNVGYSCMSPSNVQYTTELFAASAQGYIGRFCTSPPPSVTTPANPGGACPAP